MYTINNCKSENKEGLNPLTLIALIFATRSSGGIVNVSGTITYEHIPVNTSTKTLDTTGKTERPARGITVRVLDSSSNTVASTTTDSSGKYTITGANVSSSTFTVAAVAEMVKTSSPTYNFKVVNTVASGSIGTTYAVASASTSVSSCSSSCTVNVTALDSNRGNGPFSILDVVYIAIQKVLTADSNTTFPPLNLRWTSTSTTGSFFTTSSSTCGSGVSNCITLLGNRSGDSDEFDRHVIAHEFTHYLESALSRSDSVGGSHSTNDTLEPRVAYGEGLGNAMGAIFLDDPIYTDTTASGGFNLNMETGTHTNVGYYSEASVQSVIWDLYDSASDSKNSQTDNLNYSFTKIWNAVVALKSINGITYLHEFILALKNANASDTTSINSILTMETIAATEAGEGNVSKSSAGTSNAHICTGSGASTGYPYNFIIESPGGTTGTVINAVSISGSQNCGITSYANNKLFGSKFYRVTPANSGTMTVIATDGGGTTEDPDVYIFQQGTSVKTCNQGISENCQTTVTAGKVYIIEIRTYSTCAVTACGTGNTNSATITITLP
ncbi:MAG TPA: hypothetical protein PLS71_23495 [Leptospiraceae bacterium]|nr:hypothetical protein [Leptospiraceae bacterium]HNE07554.1 hypothetical protein [Leptospiraceae bacterium]HNG98754.1 hypothetical protein [Leptospiraceae bacterium]HNI89495.1 hypothetical protein [Leptospiraceae bacterium]HNK94437.1 hypothetical protein [Leptospiraceae bacterium]